MESSRKRVSIAGVVNGSPANKKMKLEMDEPPQANPDTIEAVRQRNRALELDMREKNRRIAFLLHKCQALYRQRVLANASLQGVRRQWTHVLDEIRECSRTLAPSNQSDEELSDALRAFDSLAAIKVDVKSLELHLPEWFVSIGIEKTEEAPLPASDGDAGDADERIVKNEQLLSLEREVASQTEEKRQETVELLRNLVAAVAGTKANGDALQFAHIVQEKREALEESMRVKDQLQAIQHRLADLQQDLEYKETERHRVCRDFDRLQRHIEEHGSAASSSSNGNPSSDEPSKKSSDSSVKSETNSSTEQERAAREKSLRDDIGILTTKLYQERAKIETFRRDLERYKVMEQAWKRDEASLKLEYESKIKQLQDECAHNAEQFQEAKLKAKEIEDRMGEQWKQTIAKVQADASKSKAQLDEVNIKNMKLREKLANASAFRDQLNELKPELDAIKRENKRLKELLKQSKVRGGHVEQAVESSKVRELTEKIAALETVKTELQKSLDALRTADSDEKISAYTNRLTDLEARYNEEISRHEETRSELEKARISLEEMTATADASRDENDALVAEIETLNHSVKELGHTRKKLMQQVDEKRNMCKKLHSQVQHEEQAKTHYFDEITAVRLQVSSLGSLQAQQKTLIEAIKESLKAKEKELETLKEHVKSIETERETAEAEKRKAVREAEVAKQVYATETNQKQQEKRRPCDQCDALRKKLEDTEKKLRVAALSSTSSSSSSMTELDRLELQDLQKVVKCSVCQDRKKSVIISKCFHMFCKECVDNNLKSRNRKCPTCKKMFGQDDVKSVWLT